MNPSSETCVIINQTKKVVERINCPKCNKPDMSKKNISTHYNKGCSGVMNVYKSKPIKKTKEQREQEKQLKQEQKEKEKQIKKELKEQKQKQKEEKSKMKKSNIPKNTKKQVEVRPNEEPKLTLQECYDYMCWLNEKKLFIVGSDNFKEYYNDYIMDMKEPIKLVINNIVKTIEANDKIEKMDDMISLVETIIDKGNQEIQDIQEIKLTIPNLSVKNFNQISEGDKTEIMIQEEEEINYCISCGINASEEHYDNHCEECYGKILQIEQMIKDDDVVDEEEELSDEEEEEASEPINKIIDKDSDTEYETDNDDDENYNPPINQHDNFFETYEYEYETEDEKLVVEQLNKFMQRFSEKEFKTYSDEKQGKFINALVNKRKFIVNWLKLHYKRIYYLEYNGNDFFIRTLLKLIKIKMDNFVDEFGNEDEHEEDFYIKNLTPQIERLINYYLLEMRNLMDTCFPILVEK